MGQAVICRPGRAARPGPAWIRDLWRLVLFTATRPGERSRVLRLRKPDLVRLVGGGRGPGSYSPGRAPFSWAPNRVSAGAQVRRAEARRAVLPHVGGWGSYASRHFRSPSSRRCWIRGNWGGPEIGLRPLLPTPERWRGLLGSIFGETVAGVVQVKGLGDWLGDQVIGAQ